MDFERLIKTESKVIRKLHKDIDITFKERDKSSSNKEMWSRACKTCHNYKSPMTEYIDLVSSENTYSDASLIEFVITFLEMDARFFRSGYIKEEMLRKISRSNLKSAQVSRLNYVLIDAAQARGGREYRRYCRLAVKIGNTSLIDGLSEILMWEGAAKSRARMMSNYIDTIDII